MGSLRSKQILLLAAVLLAVCGAYANHFQNGFHFDDSHTVLDNPYIRSLSNLPRFFTDTSTFSVLPANRTYRPMVSASLALDYALGHGYTPFWFHLSTFLIFLLQLIAMYGVFTAVLNAARPGSEARDSNRYASLLAVAWYGLHPAIAETVNYVIQRGDIFSTFGVVAALAVYVRWPAMRRTGLYLLPLVFGLLSKPPAVVFPVLLFTYLVLFEQDGAGRFRKAAIACLPSVVVCGLLMALQSAMTPKSYIPATTSPYFYRITQPYVLLRYFGALFLPIHLNVDTDLPAFGSLTALALLGFLFVALLLAAAWFTGRHPRLRPISFGLLWFVIASLPTSVYRLAEVENDHRMYMPFVGLVLAVVWAAVMIVEKAAVGARRTVVLQASASVAVILLAAYGYGVVVRNRVWRTDESLWLDDVVKSPHNGRGLMNYALTQMAKGAYPVALDYLEQALVYTPAYPTLEINLGVASAGINRSAEAERHFQRAIALAPADDQTHFFYGRWLYQGGRLADAVEQLETAVHLNPSRVPGWELLASAYVVAGDADKARASATQALTLAPGDPAALAILAHPDRQTADYWINASLVQFQSKNYAACIDAARQALKVKPDSELAYNNIGAAYAAMEQWDLAVENEKAALRIKPDFELAKNNLEAYSNRNAGSAAQQDAAMTADDWLNASLRDNQAGLYEKSIQDAQTALKLRPEFAEAYNNIAADYESMKNWDKAISAAEYAVRLKPDFQLAKNNLAWAQSQKKLGVH